MSSLIVGVLVLAASIAAQEPPAATDSSATKREVEADARLAEVLARLRGGAGEDENGWGDAMRLMAAYKQVESQVQQGGVWESFDECWAAITWNGDPRLVDLAGC
jgi:hypothetical protein